jgi:hypothetical protein
MKHIKYSLLGILSVLLMAFIVFIPMNAGAATVENGQSVKLLQKGKQFYKFTLKDDSLVQVSWTNNNNCSDMIIYKDKTKNDYYSYIEFEGKKGKTFIALAKGTYYFDVFDYSSKPTTTVKFNWTPASDYNKDKNYSVKTAKPLKADTIVHVVQVRKYDYYRWYKITLTKGQKLTIMAPYGNIDRPFVLNSKLDILDFNVTYDSAHKSYTSDEKLPRGTYYIAVPPSFNSNFKVGYYVAFKWK